MKQHTKCTLWKILWIIAFIDFIGASIAVYSGGTFLEYGYDIWFSSSLVLGVLSIPIKLDCHNCDTCRAGK